MAIGGSPRAWDCTESVIRRFRITVGDGKCYETGHNSPGIARACAASELEKYRIVQDRLFESDFDREINALTVIRKTGRCNDSGFLSMSWRWFVRMNRKGRRCHDTENVGSHKDAVSTLSGSFYEQLMFLPEVDSSLYHGIGHIHPLCMAGDGEIRICEQVVENTSGFLRNSFSLFE